MTRQPKPFISLAVCVFATLTVLWTSFDAYRVWRDTGINTMRGDYKRLGAVALIALVSGVAYVAQRARNRKETQQVPKAKRSVNDDQPRV